MREFKLVTKCSGYNTAFDATNAPDSILVAGSKNCLVDGRNGKVKSRKGYTRLGAANAALTPIRNGWTWNNSTGKELPQRMYDDELEVYLGTIDGTAIDAWTRVKSGLSTTETLRPALWWDGVENLDLELYVIGDDTISEWNGAVAVVDSIAATTITKTGTTTFAQNRFYTTRNKTVVCVRTGTEYTYTGGETTTTLTGIADTTGLIAGDILIQKVVVSSSEPAAGRNNDTILVFENQLILGSFDDNEVYVSKGADYKDFSYSAPRVAGEGALFTLDATSSGFGSIEKNLLLFSGRNSIYKAVYQDISVGTTLAETLAVEKLDVGIDQGCQSPDCIVSIGAAIVYLSYEPALRLIDNPDALEGVKPVTLSNEIKPDFDAEDWTNAKGMFVKNSIYLSAQANSRVYILDFIEDANGQTKRYWNPPQVLPVGAFAVIDNALHGHSNAVPETYKLFDGFSDLNSSDEKLPIPVVMAFSYRNYGKRDLLKNFDEYYVEGEIAPSTNIDLTLNYNFGGHIQSPNFVVEGGDEDILEEELGGISLGQASLGQQPIGGSTESPPESRKFRVQFELAREDFNELQPVFSSNEVDYYFSIIASGPNVTLSSAKNTPIKK